MRLIMRASELFEDLAAKRMTQEFTDYLEGVTAALGWVLGEYDEKPTD
jgi:hypothetical protein